MLTAVFPSQVGVLLLQWPSILFGVITSSQDSGPCIDNQINIYFKIFIV